MDARPYRLDCGAKTRFFEVDHPATMEAKKRALAREGVATAHVTYAPFDFERADVNTLPQLLRRAMCLPSRCLADGAQDAAAAAPRPAATLAST